MAQEALGVLVSARPVMAGVERATLKIGMEEIPDRFFFLGLL